MLRVIDSLFRLFNNRKTLVVGLFVYSVVDLEVVGGGLLGSASW